MLILNGLHQRRHHVEYGINREDALCVLLLVINGVTWGGLLPQECKIHSVRHLGSCRVVDFYDPKSKNGQKILI